MWKEIQKAHTSGMATNLSKRDTSSSSASAPMMVPSASAVTVDSVMDILLCKLLSLRHWQAQLTQVQRLGHGHDDDAPAEALYGARELADALVVGPGAPPDVDPSFRGNLEDIASIKRAWLLDPDEGPPGHLVLGLGVRQVRVHGCDLGLARAAARTGQNKSTTMPAQILDGHDRVLDKDGVGQALVAIADDLGGPAVGLKDGAVALPLAQRLAIVELGALVGDVRRDDALGQVLGRPPEKQDGHGWLAFNARVRELFLL